VFITVSRFHPSLIFGSLGQCLKRDKQWVRLRTFPALPYALNQCSCELGATTFSRMNFDGLFSLSGCHSAECRSAVKESGVKEKLILFI